jgi:hypothetical protein
MNNPFDTYSRGMTARERRIRSKYGLLLAITGIICLWLAFTHHTQKREIYEMGQEITKMQSQLDSLHDESFNASTTNGRYELSLEYLKEVNPKAAKDFEDFFSHQTE